MANAMWMPVILSATIPGTNIGASLFHANVDARPDAAWITSSYAAWSAFGPPLPKPFATQ